MNFNMMAIDNKTEDGEISKFVDKIKRERERVKGREKDRVEKRVRGCWSEKVRDRVIYIDSERERHK